jgi:hypothetical protein
MIFKSNDAYSGLGGNAFAAPGFRTPQFSKHYYRTLGIKLRIYPSNLANQLYLAGTGLFVVIEPNNQSRSESRDSE